MHEASALESPASGTVKVVEVEPLVVSIADTQKILGGISERSVYRLLDLEELESIAVGGPSGSAVGHGQGRRMILLESLRAYVARQRKGTPAGSAA